ncbi:hypothetical protein Dimus_015351, partial [Dionaea muscipula]
KEAASVELGSNSCSSSVIMQPQQQFQVAGPFSSSIIQPINKKQQHMRPSSDPSMSLQPISIKQSSEQFKTTYRDAPRPCHGVTPVTGYEDHARDAATRP